MQHTTRYLTAVSILALLGTSLTPALAADAPQAPEAPTAPAAPTAPVAPDLEAEVPPPPVITEEPGLEVGVTGPADNPAAQGVEADAVIAYPAPTMDVMDRTTWPAIVVTPADGKVTHNPHFMGDVPMGEDIVSPLHAPDPVWQIQEALRGADAGNWNGENLTALGAQPIIATAQILAIPFRAVIDNPLSKETSPK